jgi:hypothetical protein
MDVLLYSIFCRSISLPCRLFWRYTYLLRDEKARELSVIDSGLSHDQRESARTNQRRQSYGSLGTGAAFSVLINTYAGVKNVNQVLVNVVRSFGASEWQVMKIVVLPNSVPYIIAGLRLAIGRAILGVVVGEFFGSSQGLGYMIASAATNYKVDVVFVGVAIFMALSVILTFSVKALESRLASCRPETAKTF